MHLLSHVTVSNQSLAFTCFSFTVSLRRVQNLTAYISPTKNTQYFFNNEIKVQTNTIKNINNKQK